MAFDYLCHVVTRTYSSKFEPKEKGSSEEDADESVDLDPEENIRVRVVNIVQSKVLVKYGNYISNQMWWRFMTQACAGWMATSSIQFGMATTILGILTSEFLSHARSVDDVFAASHLAKKKLSFRAGTVKGNKGIETELSSMNEAELSVSISTGRAGGAKGNADSAQVVTI